MPLDTRFRAVIHLEYSTKMLDDLKRLALFFDEIHYICPGSFTLKDKVFFDAERTKLTDDGIQLLKPISIDDLEYFGAYGDLFKNEPLNEMLSIFEESGIAKDITPTPVHKELNEIRTILAAFDNEDETFIKISETEKPDKNLGLETLTYKLFNDPEPVHLAILHFPNFLEDSFAITTNLFLSHKTSSFPVFLKSRYRKEMEYRYAQYIAGLEILKETSSELISPADFKTYFGEITFGIANNLFSSELISKKTPKQIIKYRIAMSDARRHLLTENLMELASMAQDNPWNSQTKKEIEKYIFGKLNSDLLHYSDQSREVWEKMFGNIGIHLTQISTSSIVGGSAGGLLGNLVPNTSPWLMLLLGALAGAAKEAPNLVKSLTEIILEHRKERRSAIAYIAEFK